jgi:hypothetical protein
MNAKRLEVAVGSGSIFGSDFWLDRRNRRRMSILLSTLKCNNERHRAQQPTAACRFAYHCAAG